MYIYLLYHNSINHVLLQLDSSYSDSGIIIFVMNILSPATSKFSFHFSLMRVYGDFSVYSIAL